MSQNELQRVVAEMLSYKDLTPEQVEWARRIKAESDRIEAAQAVAPGGGEIDIRSSDGLEKAMARIARLDGIGACDALYELAVKHGASEAQAAGFAHTVNGAFSLLEGHVFDAMRKSGIAAAPASEPLRGSSTQFDLTDPKPASEANGQDEVKFAKELQRFYPWVVTTGNGGVAAEMVPADDGGYVLYNEAATKLAALSNLLNDMRPKPAARSAAGELPSVDEIEGYAKGLEARDMFAEAALLRRAARVEVTDAMVLRLAKFIVSKESINCKTLDEAISHQYNWRRAVSEAREMLTAALEPKE